jgi:hypothetical protein
VPVIQCRCWVFVRRRGRYGRETGSVLRTVATRGRCTPSVSNRSFLLHMVWTWESLTLGNFMEMGGKIEGSDGIDLY